MYFLRKINLWFDFIHPGIRFRIVRSVTMLAGKRHFNFIVPFFGLKYRGNLGNHIDFLTFFFGSYERGILKFLKEKVLRPQDIVFDVGANIGHHSLFFSQFSRRVYSFEPYEKVRNIFLERVSENGISNIVVVPLGLSDKEQQLEYFEPNDDNSGIGSFVSDHFSKNQKTGLILSLVSGDKYFLGNGLPCVDFIKIDVEGFEYFVLKGLQNVIHEHRPVILLEYNKKTHELTETRENFIKLFPDGYKIIHLKRMFHKECSVAEFDFDNTGDVNLLCYPEGRLR